MNSLAYGLLSLLTLSPCSGYDLMLKIDQFWQAKHSQIYPLLAELEKLDYVSHEPISQSNKPDKKVYSLTEKGKEALLEWMAEECAAPVTRDEFSLKMISIYLADPELAKKLVNERESLYAEKVRRLEMKLESLQPLIPGGLDNITIQSPYFGAVMLLQRAISVAKTQLEWCKRLADKYLE